MSKHFVLNARDSEAPFCFVKLNGQYVIGCVIVDTADDSVVVQAHVPGVDPGQCRQHLVQVKGDIEVWFDASMEHEPGVKRVVEVPGKHGPMPILVEERPDRGAMLYKTGGQVAMRPFEAMRMLTGDYG